MVHLDIAAILELLELLGIRATLEPAGLRAVLELLGTAVLVVDLVFLDLVVLV